MKMQLTYYIFECNKKNGLKTKYKIKIEISLNDIMINIIKYINLNAI